MNFDMLDLVTVGLRSYRAFAVRSSRIPGTRLIVVRLPANHAKRELPKRR